MENEQPNYYAIIPAEVRYCEELAPNEKLLYGEITALSNKTGQCFATNDYFAKLYKVEIETVSRWISHLMKNGFIEIYIDKEKGNKRYLLIKKSIGIDEKVNRGIDKKINHNNTSNNNTNNKESRTKFVPPTLEEVKQYAKEKNRLDIAEKFYQYYTADKDRLWYDSNGKKMKSWKQKFINWCNHSFVDIKTNKKDGNFTGREYKTEDMNKLFQNIDDIDV